MLPVKKSAASRHQTCVLAVLSVVLSAGAAHAEDTQVPKISGGVAVELQNDYAFSSDDPTEEFNNLTLTIEPSIKIAFTKEFSINTGLVLEQVQEPPVKGDDRFFDDQGLYVEVLTMDYQTNTLHFSAGKMHVNFGRAWDATPGIFGTDLTEEYELAENLGALAAYTFDLGESGKHTVSGQVFTADTSGLAESAFTRRQRPREGDGGPGNTGDFTSIGFSLDGGDVTAMKGLTYHAAYAHRANGTAGRPDESRAALFAAYDFTIANTVQIQPLAEYVQINDAGGNQDQDQSYITVGVGINYDAWNAAVSGTFKKTAPTTGTSIDEEHLQVSAGYAWSNGLGMDVGYKRTRNGGTDTDTFGTLLSYGFDF